MFGFKKKKENGNNALIEMSLQKALQELVEEREKNESLRNDLKILDTDNVHLRKTTKSYIKTLEVMQKRLDNIAEVCQKSPTSKVSKEIFKILED